mgnify:CR=1 FL=1
MVAMLYLLAPISLVLLNPIGFLLMGLYEPEEGQGAKKTLRRVLRRVATTPLVACTALVELDLREMQLRKFPGVDRLVNLETLYLDDGLANENRPDTSMLEKLANTYQEFNYESG